MSGATPLFLTQTSRMLSSYTGSVTDCQPATVFSRRGTAYKYALFLVHKNFACKNSLKVGTVSKSLALFMCHRPRSETMIYPQEDGYVLATLSELQHNTFYMVRIRPLLWNQAKLLRGTISPVAGPFRTKCASECQYNLAS